jgi:hypothetical protein
MTLYVADEFFAFGDQKTVDEHLEERRKAMLKRVADIDPDHLRKIGTDKAVENLVRDFTLAPPEIDFDHSVEPEVVPKPKVPHPSLPTPPGNPIRTLRYGYHMKTGSPSDLRYMPKVREGTPVKAYRSDNAVIFDVYSFNCPPSKQDQIHATRTYLESNGARAVEQFKAYNAALRNKVVAAVQQKMRDIQSGEDDINEIRGLWSRMRVSCARRRGYLSLNGRSAQ